MEKIPGGYYIKARRIKNSDIAHAPPHIREIWDYLIREANHSGKNKYGEVLERGQILTTYDEIREALHWMVGWRKKRYSKSQCEISMKFLRRQGRNGSMIATKRTTRGLIITILNYDYYQNPKNYESYKESHKEDRNESCGRSRVHDTIDKNENNEKKENTNTPYSPPKNKKEKKKKPDFKKSTIKIFEHYVSAVNPPKAHIKKTPAMNNIAKWEKDYNPEELMSAADNYNKVKTQGYVKGPSNFYGVRGENAKYFADYLPGAFSQTCIFEKPPVCNMTVEDHERLIYDS